MALNAIKSYVAPILQTPAGFPGVVEDLHPKRRLYANANRVAAVKTVTVDTAANSREYSIVLCGLTVSITSDASATVTEIATAFKNEINDNFPENGRVSASSALGVVTITGLQPGEDFGLYTLDAYLTVATTTAASNADPLQFGAVVCRTSDGLGVAAPSPNTPVAQVWHATPDADNTLEYMLGVRLIDDGRIYVASYTSDGSATVQEIVEGITADLNAKLPASTVAATEDNTKVILTAEVAGTAFEVFSAAGVGGTWTLAEATANVSIGLDNPLVGVVEFVAFRPTGQIEPDENCNVVTGADGIWLKPENAPASIASPVYVRHTDDASDPEKVAGRIRFDDDSSGDAVLVSGLELVRLAADSSGRYLFSLDRLQVA